MGKILSQYEALKAELRGTLAARSAEGRDQRLSFLLQEFDRHSSNVEAPDFLRAIVYAIATILHLEKHGGLIRRELRRFMDVADRLIRVVSLEGSEAPAITAEYHLAASQLQRRLGDHEGAFWQLCCIEAGHKAVPPPTRRRIALGLANRYLRLGHVARAKQQLQIVAHDEVELKPLLTAMIGIIHCSRLVGDLKKCKAELATFRAKLAENETFSRDLRWEELCLSTQLSNNLTPMVRSVSSRGDFKSADYALEASLWAAAAKERRWLDKSPKATSLAQTRRADLRRLASLLSTAKALESLYDPEVPKHTALVTAREILAGLAELATFDKELLALAALTRWLHRYRQPELFQFCLLEYKARCARLGIIDRDPLGLISDLLAKEP